MIAKCTRCNPTPENWINNSVVRLEPHSLTFDNKSAHTSFNQMEISSDITGLAATATHQKKLSHQRSSGTYRKNSLKSLHQVRNAPSAE
jgi:hypothetical protein